jgi:hypothetical protein
MHKRRFLQTAAALAASSGSSAYAAAAAAPSPSPVVLTISGAITRPNRHAFDPASDILLGKHGVKFDRACALDYARIAALPARHIRVTLEYDGKLHDLSGPPVTEVLRLAGVMTNERAVLAMRAVDGYAPELRLEDARRYGYIIATQRDGKPLALGGLGPLWAVYEADRFPEMAAKPVNERFATCPWALYHVDVRA